ISLVLWLFPFVNVFTPAVEEYLSKVEYNKISCDFLLKRCGCVMAAVRDLDIRKTENAEFFSKREILILFKEFLEYMKMINIFIAYVNQLNCVNLLYYADVIENQFIILESEFEGYMNSLNFTFIAQSRDELAIINNEIKQIREILLRYSIS